MKAVNITVTYRDVDGTITGVAQAMGTTEDDGATVTFPAGYLPGLAVAAKEDVEITVYQAPVVFTPSTIVVLQNEDNQVLTTQ